MPSKAKDNIGIFFCVFLRCFQDKQHVFIMRSSGKNNDLCERFSGNSKSLHLEVCKQMCVNTIMIIIIVSVIIESVLS